jgi:hypothetical protein
VIIGATIPGASPGFGALEGETAPENGASALEGQGSGPCGGETILGRAPAMQACDSGGEGAIACETKETVNVGGWGAVSSCGITCMDGYYACCNDPSLTVRAECSCIAERTRGQWAPETPW